MNRFYESPEAEIEKFDLLDGRVFTITESHEPGFEGGGGTDEDSPF